MSKVSIGKKTLDLPIIQGGMGVGISLSRLAGSVASQGGMGTISGVNPGYRSPDFMKNPLEANKKALIEEIQKAKEISQGRGMVAVNLMYAIENYGEMVSTAVEGGADAIVSGAGMPLNLPELAEESVLLAPIVSSLRALKIIYKAWMKRYGRLFDFVVVEGPLAGGHLGFKEAKIEEESLDEILKDILAWVRLMEEEWGKKVPIFAGGGIRNKQRVQELLDLGADGVQVGTPFILTHECDAHIGFKETIRGAKEEDLQILRSPVGMPARAVRNAFLEEVESKPKEIKTCLNCLKTCSPKESPYCIAKALGKSANGEKGLVFSGADIENLREIVSVREVIDRFMEDV